MNKTSYSDRARSLQYPSEIEERKRLLNAPYMKPLTEFVEALRREKGRQYGIPNFDPCDGGIAAKVLIVAEAPGPKAIASGFVSRNNDDQTAQNTARILGNSGLKREDTIIWNIIPWYLGTGEKIRQPKPEEIEEGLDYLLKLIGLLENLRAVVLIGAKAKQVSNRISSDPRIRVFMASHPSPQNLNTRPEAEKQITKVFSEVKDYLNN
jgi:uracil-DNA glycosylase family 4